MLKKGYTCCIIRLVGDENERKINKNNRNNNYMYNTYKHRHDE